MDSVFPEEISTTNDNIPNGKPSSSDFEEIEWRGKYSSLCQFNDPRAFLAVEKKVSDGREICKFLVEFMNQATKIEEKYATSMNTLLKSAEAKFEKSAFPNILNMIMKNNSSSVSADASEMEKFINTPGIREIGSLDRAWAVLKAELEKVAVQHGIVASELRYQVAGTLHVYAENETEVRKLLSDGRSSMNEIKQAEGKVQQAKEKFDKATKDEQKLQLSFDKASQKNNAQAGKLQLQLTSLRAEVATLYSKYQQAVESYNQLVDHTIKNLQKQEETRVKMAQSCFTQFAAIEHTLVPVTKVACEKISDIAEAVNIDQDTILFLETIALPKTKAPMTVQPLPQQAIQPPRHNEQASQSVTQVQNGAEPKREEPKEAVIVSHVEPVESKPNQSDQETERLQKEAQEKQRLEQEHLEQQKRETENAQRVERERIEAEQKLAKERQESEQQREKEQQDRERIAKEQEKQSQPHEEKKVDHDNPLVQHLLETAKENDFVALFGLNPNEPFTLDDINKKRRELTKMLHPDHFHDDPVAQEDAGKKLAKINEVYTNLFKQESSLDVYKKLCEYRREYHNLLNRDEDQLQVACNNILRIKKVMKSSNMPSSLIKEIDEILELLRQCKNIVPTE